MPPKRERVTYRIRELRRHRGLTQAQLATRVGCTESFISQLERQVSAPSDVMLLRLAHALQVPVEALVSDGLLPATPQAVP